MHRLSAQAFDMTAGARAWLPAEDANPVDAGEEVSSQPETYRKAYLEGFEAGFADGDQDARRALQEAQDTARAAEEAAHVEEGRWRAALASLSKQFAQLQEDLQPQMEGLAVTIAFASICRLIGRRHAEHDLVASLCREALDSMHLDATRVRISQADQASLEEGSLALPVVADPVLEPGDCIIETPLGGIEAGIEVQLRALLQTLLATLDREGQRP